MRHRKLDPSSDASHPILNSALSRQMDSILAQGWHDSEGQGFPVLLSIEQHRAVRAPVSYAAKKSIMSKSRARAVLSRAPPLHKTPQLEDLEGAHHVVVLVLEDMAVPHVLAGDFEVRPVAQGFSDNDAGTLVAGVRPSGVLCHAAHEALVRRLEDASVLAELPLLVLTTASDAEDTQRNRTIWHVPWPCHLTTLQREIESALQSVDESRTGQVL